MKNVNEHQMPKWTVWLILILLFIFLGLALSLFTNPLKEQNKIEFTQRPRHTKK